MPGYNKAWLDSVNEHRAWEGLNEDMIERRNLSDLASLQCPDLAREPLDRK
jgi:hypothetical protein